VDALRRIHRSDSSQAAIVDALRKAGVTVFVIGKPVDLLTHYRGKWLPLECKPATHKRARSDQSEQEALLTECGIPKVRTPEEALRAVLPVSRRFEDQPWRVGM
jgi:hypothetical protein